MLLTSRLPIISYLSWERVVKECRPGKKGVEATLTTGSWGSESGGPLLLRPRANVRPVQSTAWAEATAGHRYGKQQGCS